MKEIESEAIRKIAVFIEDYLHNEEMKLGVDPSTRRSVFSFETDLLKIIRAEIDKQNLRKKYFPSELFGEPAWNILLDLYDSSLRGRAVTVSDACIASQAPPTTGIRWVQRLEELDLLERHRSSKDARINYLTLTERAQQQLRDFFSAVAE